LGFWGFGVYSVPSTRGCGVTMIGGVTNKGDFHYLMEEKTNTKTVEAWFKHLSNQE